MAKRNRKRSPTKPRANKTKRTRTPAQIAATKRMLEAARAKKTQGLVRKRKSPTKPDRSVSRRKNRSVKQAAVTRRNNLERQKPTERTTNRASLMTW